jgi:hypothetical protein
MLLLTGAPTGLHEEATVIFDSRIQNVRIRTSYEPLLPAARQLANLVN